MSLAIPNRESLLTKNTMVIATAFVVGSSAAAIDLYGYHFSEGISSQSKKIQILVQGSTMLCHCSCLPTITLGAVSELTKRINQLSIQSDITNHYSTPTETDQLIKAAKCAKKAFHLFFSKALFRQKIDQSLELIAKCLSPFCSVDFEDPFCILSKSTPEDLRNCCDS